MLVGSTGTGKTHLVCSAGRYTYCAPRKVFATSPVLKLLKKIMGSWSRKNQTEQSVIDELASYDLLIVDEVGLHDSALVLMVKPKA